MAKLRPNQFTLPSGAVITEHPILFQTEMVKANMEGRKNQTRRTKGLEVRNENPDAWTRVGARTNLMYPSFKDFDDKINWSPLFEFIKVNGQEENKSHFTRPRYKTGDLLWVKETWGRPALDVYLSSVAFLYKVDYSDPIKVKGALSTDHWKPSIHMPKAASRIWAMVEDIRVERVQDISEEDSLNEGVIEYDDFTFKNYFTKKGLRAEDGVEIVLAKGSFQSLICNINGMEFWNSNPWVWVIKYRILSKTGRPSMEVIEKNYLEVSGKGFDSAQPDTGKEGTHA